MDLQIEASGLRTKDSFCALEFMMKLLPKKCRINCNFPFSYLASAMVETFPKAILSSLGLVLCGGSKNKQ